MEESKEKSKKYHNLKNKLIYAVCFGSMLALLSTVYYICFFRDIHIDLTKNLEVSFVGENGNGEIITKRHDFNYNQRIEPFYQSLSVSFSDNGGLSNGDEVTLSVTYDASLAEKFNIVVDEESITKTVEGLAQRFTSKEEITAQQLTMLNERSAAYMKKDEERILKQDFNYISDGSINEQAMIKRVFLKANDAQIHDKIIDIYKMSAEGKGEEGTTKQETIYYMVVFDDINSNMELNDDHIYGEKALSTDEDLSSDAGIIHYFRNKYVLSYDVELL